ncbi:MAG TPA: helix-turn-helix domain-containing protein [Stellaceae bacterium]|nr:helix-turn-helix domain-containing protein [Stellaceae bacterium]
MGRAQFEPAHFLEAARDLAAANGPAAVTVGSVTTRLGAPTGSFYHRFASRDVLLGELWLKTVLAMQQGFVAAIDRGDGLGAALHVPAWSREHLDDARLLLLHHRDDFVHGDWPAALKQGVADQARRFVDCLARIAAETFGGTGAEPLRLARFVLADVPIAAVRAHLERREPPPLLVDDLIRTTYRAVVNEFGRGGARRS